MKQTDMKRPQPHKLLEHRTGTGLTQDELAFLLGASSGARISKYESFRRLPELDMAMAYVAIHQRSVEDLFEGRYLEVATQVLGRARELHARLAKSPADSRKVEIIQTLILVLERGIQRQYD